MRTAPDRSAGRVVARHLGRPEQRLSRSGFRHAGASPFAAEVQKASCMNTKAWAGVEPRTCMASLSSTQRRVDGEALAGRSRAWP